ncbi:MAG: TonB-dependent receptor [Crocinitomicaceae bacterium]|nr:TonB-dependent receptor [Crocinitomicaceae bacterium]|tara:strand:+ start:10679 stop:13252 length:2574 start_codon:yes stop_codon:yes gene_type:complete
MKFGNFKLILIPFLLLIFKFTSGQETAVVFGTVVDSLGQPVEAVSIGIVGTTKGATTKEDGTFKITVPANKDVQIAFSFIGYKSRIVSVNLKPGENYEANPILKRTSKSLTGITIEAEEREPTNLVRIDPTLLKSLPSASGNFETILFTLPGVSSTNELSSGYNVRGGNFDENLIYVNDVEIYRPFLVRSGQQEGLSFINSNLVSSIQFSAGGFEAKYGDKMSSVLDIKYKEPKKFGGSASISLLGGSIHLEHATKDHRLTQIHGFRYRSNQYLLQGLQTQGDYKPRFYDYQGYLTYDITDKLELGLLMNYSNNRYQFIPESRETEFGTVNEALQLTVFFEGQEIDEYQTGLGALTLDYMASKNVNLKLIGSAYRTVESETFDISGAYRLDELEKDLGSEDFGEVKFNRGVGGFIDHARNYLEANVANIQHKGIWVAKFAEFRWGGRWQYEQIKDEIKEWEYQDSTGYSSPQYPGLVGYTFAEDDTAQLRPIPVSPRSELNLKTKLNSKNDINSNRLMGYIQGSKVWDIDSNELSFIAGVRANYWDFNNELVISPRMSLGYTPNWKSDWNFRLAWGYYYQPPFYREMRDLNGQINYNIKAQTSIHYVFGSDLNFTMGDRPFKFTGELYYKQFKNLIPYEYDNVRIRYYATNNAVGYAAGVDLKLFGQFVKGIDSWLSLSVMKTEEDLLDDFYYDYYNAEGEKIIPGFTFDQVATDSVRNEPGYIPRPTDQRVQVGLFFQDYVPKIPDLKVNLNFIFATGLPFGPPTHERYKDVQRMPPYRRVDIGFSYDLLKESRKRNGESPFRFINNAWISLEIFNLLGINNTISYLWIRDINNRVYGIPNYLTNRRLNLKLAVEF